MKVTGSALMSKMLVGQSHGWKGATFVNKFDCKKDGITKFENVTMRSWSQEGMAIIDGRIESVASVVRNQEGMVTIARRLEGVANISVRQEGVVSRGMLGKSGAIRRPGHGEMPTRRLTCMWWRCCRGWCSRRPR